MRVSTAQVLITISTNTHMNSQTYRNYEHESHWLANTEPANSTTQVHFYTTDWASALIAVIRYSLYVYAPYMCVRGTNTCIAMPRQNEQVCFRYGVDLVPIFTKPSTRCEYMHE